MLRDVREFKESVIDAFEPVEEISGKTLAVEIEQLYIQWLEDQLEHHEGKL